MGYTLNIVSKCRVFFIFKHLWAPKRSWKIFHGGPGKSWKSPGFFLSIKECEPCHYLHQWQNWGVLGENWGPTPRPEPRTAYGNHVSVHGWCTWLLMRAWVTALGDTMPLSCANHLPLPEILLLALLDNCRFRYRNKLTILPRNVKQYFVFQTRSSADAQKPARCDMIRREEQYQQLVGRCTTVSYAEGVLTYRQAAWFIQHFQLENFSSPPE